MPVEKEIQMMKICKSIIAALAMTVLLVAIFGCKEGPGERAGKKIDITGSLAIK